MAIKKSSLVGITGVVVFIAGLYFLPDLLRKKHFELPHEGIDTKASLKTFDLGQPLQLLQLQGKNQILPGKTVKLRDYLTGDHETLIINFWASWCSPCLEELPSLEHLSRQLQAKTGKRPLLVTISVDEGTKEIGNILGTLDFKPTFLMLFDKGGAFSSASGTTKFPETYWVRKDGIILHKWLGPQDWLSSDVVFRLSQNQ